MKLVMQAATSWSLQVRRIVELKLQNLDASLIQMIFWSGHTQWNEFLIRKKFMKIRKPRL